MTRFYLSWLIYYLLKVPYLESLLLCKNLLYKSELVILWYCDYSGSLEFSITNGKG